MLPAIVEELRRENARLREELARMTRQEAWVFEEAARRLGTRRVLKQAAPAAQRQREA